MSCFPEDALPENWRELTAINAAWVEGAEAVDRRVDAYVVEHDPLAIEAQR